MNSTRIATDLAITKLATLLLTQVQSGTVDRTLFNAKTNGALTPELVASVTQPLAPLGKPKNVTVVAQSLPGGYLT